jgi:hypothetical protein
MSALINQKVKSLLPAHESSIPRYLATHESVIPSIEELSTFSPDSQSSIRTILILLCRGDVSLNHTQPLLEEIVAEERRLKKVVFASIFFNNLSFLFNMLHSAWAQERNSVTARLGPTELELISAYTSLGPFNPQYSSGSEGRQIPEDLSDPDDLDEDDDDDYLAYMEQRLGETEGRGGSDVPADVRSVCKGTIVS